MKPIVSVIIPSYNTASLIRRALQSALAQSLQSLEVVVVDDASTDDSVAVLREFADERVKVFVLPTNQGAGAARNRAIEESSGKWVAVLDSDDWYAPNRLERLVGFAEARGADIVADDLYLIRDGEPEAWGTLFGPSAGRLAGSPVDATALIRSETFDRDSLRLGLCKPLFLRSFLNERAIRYDPTIKVTQDFWMLLECLMQGGRFELLPEPLYYYLARPGSLVSSSRTDRLLKDARVCEAVMARPEVARDQTLLKALVHKRRAYGQLLAYNQIGADVKAGHWRSALETLVREPGALWWLLRRLPEALWRRFRRYILRDRTALDMLYRRRRRRR